MGRWCPVIGGRVVYLACQECEDRACRKGDGRQACVLGPFADPLDEKISAGEKEGTEASQ